MKLIGIRNRMLLAALLPVALVALVLAAVFLLSRFEDINTAHSQRTRSLARQLATASEYGVFSGNVIQLQTLARGALREPDVRSMTVVDAQGRFLARAGPGGYTSMPRLDISARRLLSLCWYSSIVKNIVFGCPISIQL